MSINLKSQHLYIFTPLHFYTFILLSLYTLIPSPSFAQNSSPLFRLAFYNVENLFDYFDDSLKNDDSFTPLGANHWKKARYEQKINHLYQTIIAMGNPSPPAILGFCEVENDKVLLDLIKGTPLRYFNYDFVHYESADSRGIDVALIYRKDICRLDTSYPIKFIVPPDTISKTRDFLYCKFSFLQNSTINLNVFVCHFPSKYGGLMLTKQRRFLAGRLLRKNVDAIFQKDPDANIVTIGDFNDEASDESITEGFGALCYNKNLDLKTVENAMFNLMCNIETKYGSHKFQDTWSVIDQIMVSKSLFCGTNCLKTTKAEIFSADFLLVDDKKHLGKKTNRTYIGFKYNGGYSDHLPVYVDVDFEKD